MQQNLQDKTLVLFFTYGVSLKLWQEKGMLSRELALYKKLGQYFKKIYLITYGNEDSQFADELASYNIEVLHKKSRLPNIFYSIVLPIVYWKKLKKADYYKTNQMHGSWAAVIAKVLFRKKLIVRTGYTLSIFSKKDNQLKYLISKLIEAIAIRSANKFVVATAKEAEFFSKHQEKIKIIPNYVDTDLFKPMPEFKNEEEGVVLLYIGRFNKQKNLLNLLYALKGLEKVRLIMIGSGELEQSLRSVVTEHQLNVEFIENQPHHDLPKHINHADVFVMPSLFEGNPKLLIEAMACGIVVLATNVQGINNIIKHNVNGILSQTESDSIRQSLIVFLENRNGHDQLGSQARSYILDNYSLDKIIQKELLNYL